MRNCIEGAQHSIRKVEDHWSETCLQVDEARMKWEKRYNVYLFHWLREDEILELDIATGCPGDHSSSVINLAPSKHT